MFRCPSCEGNGFYFGGEAGGEAITCDVCDGRGQAFDGTRKIPRFFRNSKYVIDCPKCGQENPLTAWIVPANYDRKSCFKCGYKFT